MGMKKTSFLVLFSIPSIFYPSSVIKKRVSNFKVISCYHNGSNDFYNFVDSFYLISFIVSSPSKSTKSRMSARKSPLSK